MSRIRKGTRRNEMKPRGKRSVLIVLVIAAAVGLFAGGRYVLRSDNPLSWNGDKVCASPENTVRYIRARLENLIERLPPKTPHTFMGGLTARECIVGLLESRRLEQGVDIIKRGRLAAKNGGRLELVMFPDHHAHNNGKQEGESISRQPLISEAIKAEGLALVFAEGLEHELSWDNAYQDVLSMCRLLGMPEPPKKTFKEDFDKTGPVYWWRSFIDAGVPKVIGIEEGAEVGRVVTMLAELECEGITKEEFENLAVWLNYTFRSQLITAKIALQMREKGIGRVGLVLGEAHVPVQQYFCKELGIDLKIHSVVEGVQ